MNQELNTPLWPFDPTAIQKVCASKIWPNDLVFQCHWIVGGMGNVRQEIFACLRWAIESGASFIIPDVYVRKNASDKSARAVLNEWDEPIDLGVLFDKEKIVSRIGEGCPQMKVFRSKDEMERRIGISGVKDLGTVGGGDLGGQSWGEWISENRAPVGNVSLVTFRHTLSE